MALAMPPIPQPTIIVTNAHNARPLSFLDLHAQATITVATTYTKIGWLTTWITVSAGTRP